MQYNFEWDPAKAKENLRKHGVSFPRATRIFADPHTVTIEDEAHSEEEDRWVSLGKDENAIILVVNHTFREIDAENFVIRLISARKATHAETRQYSMRREK